MCYVHIGTEEICQVEEHDPRYIESNSYDLVMNITQKNKLKLQL